MRVNQLTTFKQPYSRNHTNLVSNDNGFTTTFQEQLETAKTATQNTRMTGRFVWVPTGMNQVKIISIKYADDSTPDSPIMCDSHGNHRTAIKDIDPQNASEMEIQMLCAHLDTTGRGTGSKFGTYNDLRTARMAERIAQTNNLSSVIPTFYQRVHDLCDWTKIINDYMKIVKGNDPTQYASMKHISNIFNTISDQRKYT